MGTKRVSKGRRNFIKTGAAGLAGAAVLPSVLKGGEKVETKKTEGKQKFIYRTLGKTGIKLPVVSMGVMNADNPKLVEAALEAGIVHLDTAYYYQRGRNEEMIGKVIKDRPRDSFVIGTKVPGDYMDRKTGLFTEKTKASSFIEKFEVSLKRLGLEYVEILYLHSVTKKEAVLFEPLLGALQKLKKAGKAKFIGVSTHRGEPEVLRATADSKIYDVVLTAYNFKQPHAAEVKKAIAYAAGKGLGIAAMKTQAGVYWDKEKQQPINMKAALKWALLDENVHTAIPGFTTFDQMNLDLSVMDDLTLTPREKLDLKLGQKAGLTGLYCRQCEKCIPQCGKNIEIPTLMRSFMYAYGYKNLALAKETLNDLDLSTLPCSNCNTCTVNCTMGFNVRDKILDIARIKDIPADFLV
jgi:predicted aldo/keto reductase-like oxidoreductase